MKGVIFFKLQPGSQQTKEASKMATQKVMTASKAKHEKNAQPDNFLVSC